MYENNGYSPDRIIEMPPQRPRDPRPDEKLSRALGFNAQDLAANRAGWISEAQRTRLEANRRRLLFRVGTYAIGLIAIVIGWTFALNILTQMETILLVAAFAALLLALGVLMSITMQIFQSWQALRIDIRVEEVRAAAGLVLIQQEHNSYTLTIERKTFKLNATSAAAFRHLNAYIVYYTPQSRTILSAMPTDSLEA